MTEPHQTSSTSTEKEKEKNENEKEKEKEDPLVDQKLASMNERLAELLYALRDVKDHMSLDDALHCLHNPPDDHHVPFEAEINHRYAAALPRPLSPCNEPTP